MISVIIPTYNEEKVIGQCLISLLDQKDVNFEIIIVDDGSTDQTLSEVNKQQKTNNKIKIFKQKHQGPGMARNLGVTKAKGDILVFVDSDMTFDKYFLKELTQSIERGKTKGTFTKKEFVSNWENIWARCWNYNLGIKENQRIPDSYPNSAPVFRAILKKEFEKVGGFDSIGYTDDWSLSRKLGYKSTVVEKALCFHKNPEDLYEAYLQAKWIGKNEFLSKGFRRYINLIRYCPPVSLIVGIIKSIIYKQPKFIQFKLIYDQGIFISIIESFFNRNLYKN